MTVTSDTVITVNDGYTRFFIEHPRIGQPLTDTDARIAYMVISNSFFLIMASFDFSQFMMKPSQDVIHLFPLSKFNYIPLTTKELFLAAAISAIVAETLGVVKFSTNQKGLFFNTCYGICLIAFTSLQTTAFGYACRSRIDM